MIVIIEKNNYHRENAKRNESYVKNMRNTMVKKNKRKKSINIGNCVKLLVLKIDRKFLILNIYDGNLYQLVCQSGILEICYSAPELELVDNRDIPDLRNTPTIRVSVKEAARLQIINGNSNANNNTVCAYKKGECKNRLCPCRKKFMLEFSDFQKSSV